MKRIMYTQRVSIVSDYQERRDCADQRIAEFLYACGFLPIPVPNNVILAEKMFYELSPNGVVFTGGNNLLSYGGDAPERDETEFRLLKLAKENHIPVYGFCRGMQLILTDAGCQLEKVEEHVVKHHMITGPFGSREVNSYHTLGCKKMDEKEFAILASSQDGVIEAVADVGNLVLGTMWHPERELPYDKADVKMVQRLFLERRVEI